MLALGLLLFVSGYVAIMVLATIVLIRRGGQS